MLPIKDALYVINHSGGKDSQAMYLLLRDIIPANQLVVIHAHLPGVEWEGTTDHIQNTIGNSEFHIVQARKTFFEMVEHRQKWPDAQRRNCTSDLKRGPINSKVINIANERGFKAVVNCMGLRAAESSNRAKKEPFKKSDKNSNTKRDWYEWLPIHTWTTPEVFDFISSKGQQPHWAYAKGMTRLSCCFCIMASKSDLKTAAALNPELLAKYDQLERKIGHTLIMPSKKNGVQFLTDIVNS